MTGFSSLPSLSKLQSIFLLDVKVKPNASLKFQRDFADKSTTDTGNFVLRNEENTSGNRTL